MDTNVVSALRVRGHNRQVEVWVASIPLGDQFVTATTVVEIERGVIHDHVLPTFADRVLPTGYCRPGGSSRRTGFFPSTQHFEPLGVPCLNPWEADSTTAP